MDEVDFDFDFDWAEQFSGLGEDWDVIERVLPDGWQDAARQTGALRRTRGFKDAATLLRVLLIIWWMAARCARRPSEPAPEA